MPTNRRRDEATIASALERRQFLQLAMALPWLAAGLTADETVPIVDSHIHLFDRNKPGGTFYPRPDDPAPGISALPARYREVIRGRRIVGAVVVEASPWVEENQWILDQAADPIILGYVGFIDPGLPDFGKHLERFHRNRLLVGLRYSNRNQRPTGAIDQAVGDAAFIANLRLLAAAQLSLDLGIAPHPSALLRVVDKVPALRLVVPHLPAARLPEQAAARDAYLRDLAELARRPHVYMKLTEIVHKVNQVTVTELSAYKDKLDQLWGMFGEDRVLFGSDWPNSEHVGTFDQVVGVAQAYIATHGLRVADKVYWRNSAAAYRWTPRTKDQPRL